MGDCANECSKVTNKRMGKKYTQQQEQQQQKNGETSTTHQLNCFTADRKATSFSRRKKVEREKNPNTHNSSI